MTKRISFFIALLLVSWCVMAFTHEMGHILGGVCCGGTLVSADLYPWHLPYSFFNPDPMPLVTLWSGPLIGVIFPVVVAFIVRQQWIWFIANFCMLANGTYLALAWLSNDQLLDTPKLLAHGAHPVTLILYCVVTIGFGYVRFRRSCLQVLIRSNKEES